jgi:translocation and assembly module TamB
VKKILLIIAACLLVLVALLGTGWWWLTATQPGAGWALNRASGALPSLEWSSFEGDLRSGLVVRDLRLSQAGTSVSLAEVELAVRISLPPAAAVDVDWLRVRGGQVQLPPPSEETATDQPLKLPDLSSPIPIRIHELTLTDMAIHPSATEQPPIEISRVRLIANIDEQLSVQALDVELPDLTAAASGTVTLSPPFDSELAVGANAEFGNGIQHALTADLNGNLDRMRIDLALSGPGELAGSVEVVDPLGDLGLNAALTGHLGGWPDLDLGIDGIELDVEGSPQAWQLALGGRLVGASVPENHWRFDLSGDLERIEIRQGQINTLGGEINLNGDVDLAAGPKALIRLSAADINPSEFVPDWPDTVRLQGSLDLAADPLRVDVDNLDFSAPPTALALSGGGHWMVAEEELGLSLDWRDLAWPPTLDGSSHLFESRSGTLKRSGPLSEWQLELDSWLKMLDQPELEIGLRAGGNQNSINIEQLSAEAGAAGRVAATGSVQIQPEPAADLALRVSALDTGRFLAELPGRIDADLGLSLQAPESVSIDVRSLSGQLRDQPLSGQGRMTLRRDQPEAGKLELALGDNALLLSSPDGRRWDVALTASALHQLAPPLSGRLDLNGQVDMEAGRAQWEAALADAGFADIFLQQASVQSDLQWLGDRPAGELALDVTDLDLNPWDRIEQLEFTLGGHCDEHQGQLNLISQRGNLDLGLVGALNSCTLADIHAWTGQLSQLYLANTIAGDWSLDQGLDVSVTHEAIRTGSACLVESATREGRICLNRLDISDGGQVELTIAQMPMDLLLVPLDPIVNLTTPLSGHVQAGWTAAGGLSNLAGEFNLGAGVLQPLGADTSLLAIDSVRLAFQPEAEAMKVSLEALLEGSSRINGEARLLDLNDFSTAMLDAEARLNLPDIGVFNRLVTDLDELGGRLNGEIRLSGALLAPELDGRITLSEGLIVNAPLGLRVNNIDLTVEATETSADLTGRMNSGDGTASVQGRLELVEDQWEIDARFSGEQFEFANVDWLKLRASPELHVQRSGSGLTVIDGDIRVDHLRAGVPPGTAEQVTSSDDIRVRGESDEQDGSATSASQIQGRLGLDLGNDARLAALGMQAALAGGLEMSWDGQRIEPSASGIITIPEGSYRAYGQNLEIDGGEIIFTGQAIDNPRLDIEAVREIFGDPLVEAAGVRIRGNAQAPNINLFTDPPTSEEKALAYVVTGANFDHASGQAAVNIGFYLLPKLFVSYGIGLFEAGNVLSGRYELSRRWGVRVVSGERDTGVDLSYAIDR